MQARKDGTYVIIADETVLGMFETAKKAHEYAREELGDKAFMIKRLYTPKTDYQEDEIEEYRRRM